MPDKLIPIIAQSGSCTKYQVSATDVDITSDFLIELNKKKEYKITFNYTNNTGFELYERSETGDNIVRGNSKTSYLDKDFVVFSAVGFVIKFSSVFLRPMDTFTIIVTEVTSNSSGGGTGGETDLGTSNNTEISIDITSSTGESATLNSATETLAGLLSAADKTKLDTFVSQITNLKLGEITDTGIEVIPFIGDTEGTPIIIPLASLEGEGTSGLITSEEKSKLVNLQDVFFTYLEQAIKAGTNITLEPNEDEKTLTINSTGGGSGGNTDLSIQNPTAETFSIKSSTGNTLPLPSAREQKEGQTGISGIMSIHEANLSFLNDPFVMKKIETAVSLDLTASTYEADYTFYITFNGTTDNQQITLKQTKLESQKYIIINSSYENLKIIGFDSSSQLKDIITLGGWQQIEIYYNKDTSEYLYQVKEVGASLSVGEIEENVLEIKSTTGYSAVLMSATETEAGLIRGNDQKKLNTLPSDILAGTNITIDKNSTTNAITINSTGGSSDDSNSNKKESVKVITAEALPAYTAAGDILTFTAQGILIIDGISEWKDVETDSGSIIPGDATAASRVYVIFGNDSGIYHVLNKGSASSVAKLQRAVDAKNGTQFRCGSYAFATNGTKNAGVGYILNTPNPIVFGTTALIFQILSSSNVTPSQEDPIRTINISPSLNELDLNDAIYEGYVKFVLEIKSGRTSDLNLILLNSESLLQNYVINNYSNNRVNVIEYGETLPFNYGKPQMTTTVFYDPNFAVPLRYFCVFGQYAENQTSSSIDLVVRELLGEKIKVTLPLGGTSSVPRIIDDGLTFGVPTNAPAGTIAPATPIAGSITHNTLSVTERGKELNMAVDFEIAATNTASPGIGIIFGKMPNNEQGEPYQADEVFVKFDTDIQNCIGCRGILEFGKRSSEAENTAVRGIAGIRFYDNTHFYFFLKVGKFWDTEPTGQFDFPWFGAPYSEEATNVSTGIKKRPGENAAPPLLGFSNLSFSGNITVIIKNPSSIEGEDIDYSIRQNINSNIDLNTNYIGYNEFLITSDTPNDIDINVKTADADSINYRTTFYNDSNYKINFYNINDQANPTLICILPVKGKLDIIFDPINLQYTGFIN